MNSDRRENEPLALDAIRAGLKATRCGKSFHYLEEIDSTNLYARKLAERGGRDGEIVIAEAQTQGRGRMGRGWVSPPYRNLYLSVILRPRLPAEQTAQITLMAAVAVAETVEEFLSFPPEIKWPNDVLVRSRKLAGMLTEACWETNRAPFVILGIGVNLNFPAELMPPVLRDKATSLMEILGTAVDRTAFTRRLIERLDRWYGALEEDGFAAIRTRWEDYFALRGKRVKVVTPGAEVTGKALGIDPEGRLLLDLGGERHERILAGEVVPLEP